MLRRAAIGEKFSFAQNHSLCWILQSAKTFGMEYGTKILWRGCKESTSGWDRQLKPLQEGWNLFLVYQRILEMEYDVKIFSAISPMRQGRKVHVCEADGKSFLLAFNRCIVSWKGGGNRKTRTEKNSFVSFPLCVSCLFISFILNFLFSFSFFPSRTRPGWRQLGRQQPAPAQHSETLIHFFCFFSNF